VRVESTVKVGTTIHVCLPVSVAAERLIPSDSPSSETPLSRGERVLVVDDDAGVRQFIVQCLRFLGYTVTEAAGGQAGLDRIATDRPDLMVVDFAMPGVNGAQVAADARKAFPTLAVLLVTGYADAQAIKDLVKSEAVLRKPFKVSDLAVSVRRALDETARVLDYSP
jgi:CheY-like chemotaxis protein